MDKLTENFLKNRDQDSCLNLVRYLRCNNLFELGKYLSPLFIKMFPHSIEINDELGIIHYYLKEYNNSYIIFKNILKISGIDENRSKKIIFNQHFNINHVKEKYIFYNQTIIKQILSSNKIKLSKRITFTITSCKRFDLFTKTINSFINCCKDINMIDEWFCVDDNSSDEDRDKMKEHYPFFTFYFKTLEEKGHPKSMNIIREHVKTPYIFHMEDDWMFFEKKKYISECLEILDNDSDIKQCLINKNYSETSDDQDITGGIFKTTQTGLRYYIHEHTKNADEEDEFYKKNGYGKNCSYWPHFSFRPSLLKTHIFQELGAFNENTNHFEMDYSYKYVAKNYKSAFLESIFSIHIGRLTSERNDSTKSNAYILNNEPQFINKTEKLYKTLVINLDRRPDRYQHFINNKNISDFKYERFSAIDGEKLQPNCQLQHIFENNDFNMRKGMVGCAMSHIKICIQLLNDDEVDTYCVLEDDLDFVDDFKNKLNLCISKIEKENWDILYLGHHLWKECVDDNVYSNSLEPTIKQYNRMESMKISMGGTGGYLINKKGAEKLLEFININGMTNGIDTVQQKSADDLNIFYCYPHLIYSECYTGEDNVDTDIQKDFSSLSLDFNEFLTKELNFYQNNISHISYEYLHEFLKNWEDNLPECIFCVIKDLNINKLLDSIKYPYYILNSRILFITKNNNGRLFHRFKINDKWNIDEALQ
tara:strand:+ start:1302 stop:3419 length:2118 start_codon:yes stop_codon:yes gene_type:complete